MSSRWRLNNVNSDNIIWEILESSFSVACSIQHIRFKCKQLKNDFTIPFQWTIHGFPSILYCSSAFELVIYIYIQHNICHWVSFDLQPGNVFFDWCIHLSRLSEHVIYQLCHCYICIKNEWNNLFPLQDHSKCHIQKSVIKCMASNVPVENHS